jgi:3-oxoacyl-(acyl-carrier-protein) synthase
MLDANGLDWKSCINHYKNNKAPNLNSHLTDVIFGLPKYDVPINDETLSEELKKENYTEHFSPRVIKLAMKAVINATRDFDLPENTAVIGVTLQGSQEIMGSIWKSLIEEKKSVGPRKGAVATQSSICTSISRFLGLRGPSLMINQGCSAFITALDIAKKFLITDEVDAAIVVGVDTATHPFTAYVFNSMGIHTTVGLRPFDKNRSGVAMGEAAVCYILTKENTFREKIAEISDIKIFNDYYNFTSPNPNGIAGRYLLSHLTENNKIEIESINCHATGSKIGDEIEIYSLEDLPYSCPIYGLKGSIGHTMASSAGVEMAYSIAGMIEGWIPYTANTADPLNSKHKIILEKILEKEQQNFVKLSFGFGGTSAGIRITKIGK